jgi:peptide/nickel transport system permease protein
MEPRTEDAPAPIPAWRRYLVAIWRDKLTLFALLLLIFFILAALFPGLIAPKDPLSQSLSLRNEPPMTPAADGGLPHLFGTDPLGRDVLSRLIHGARVSLSVGFAGVIVSGVIGVLLGVTAGYLRGWTDDLVMRTVDLTMGLPFLVLAIFVLHVIGGGLTNIVLILALVRWPLYARVSRGLTLALAETSIVEAARSLGCSQRRIIFRHLLPNLMSPMLVLATLELARLILAEASLSFLGLGIQPPEPSWGLMISDGRPYIRTSWWVITFPGIFILLTALSANLLATWLRAVSDPAQRWRWLTGQKRRSSGAADDGGPA